MEKVAKTSLSRGTIYEYLNKNGDGYLSSLDSFGQNEVTHLCKLGFLTRGKDSENRKRYRVTSLGRKQIRIVCAQNSMENALDTIIDILP